MVDFSQEYSRLILAPQVILPLLFWQIFWKGLALWRAAKKEQITWFVLLLFFNSLGILEIGYLFYLHRWDLGSTKVLKIYREKFRTKVFS